jgi:predicted DNA-binding protein with PD1-like motif
MKGLASESVRYVVLSGQDGDVLPDALVRLLAEHDVRGGWLRATGLLVDVAIRGYAAELGGQGPVRRIQGPIEAVSLDGAIGVLEDEPTVTLKVVLARETELGLETVAGELVSARVVVLDGLVTVVDGVVVPRALDRRAAPDAPKPRVAKPDKPDKPDEPDKPDDPWSAAVAASVEADDAPVPVRRGQAGASGPVIPPRPVRRRAMDDMTLFPEPADIVEHFAFGRCEVVKSDGDRLHLKVDRDGRIKEIALEMLRVTELASEDGKAKHFRLDRKL